MARNDTINLLPKKFKRAVQNTFSIPNKLAIFYLVDEFVPGGLNPQLKAWSILAFRYINLICGSQWWNGLTINPKVFWQNMGVHITNLKFIHLNSFTGLCCQFTLNVIWSTCNLSYFAHNLPFCSCTALWHCVKERRSIIITRLMYTVSELSYGNFWQTACRLKACPTCRLLMLLLSRYEEFIYVSSVNTFCHYDMLSGSVFGICLMGMICFLFLSIWECKVILRNYLFYMFWISWTISLFLHFHIEILLTHENAARKA